MSQSPQRTHAETVHDLPRDSGRPTRFRFKSHNADDRHSDRGQEGHKRRRDDEDVSRHRRKRHRSSRRHDDHRPQHLHSTETLPPDQAFRESLFDALGDDEGAQFWEGVYGQPIHNYSDTYQNEETGELERMTDEEYAQFVRRKMWEKSWEGIEAAKEEKRRERQQEKKKKREEASEGAGGQPRSGDHLFDFQIEESLRRGERRKDRKRWQVLWQEYLSHWDALKSLAQRQHGPGAHEEQLFLRNKIAWPVETGKRKDVARNEVECFLEKGTTLDSERESAEAFLNAVKGERIRWHPDKIQQRYGFMEIDDYTLKGVTAVFQIVDAIWTELRSRKDDDAK